jgi:hypothetical protein
VARPLEFVEGRVLAFLLPVVEKHVNRFSLADRVVNASAKESPSGRNL